MLLKAWILLFFDGFVANYSKLYGNLALILILPCMKSLSKDSNEVYGPSSHSVMPAMYSFFISLTFLAGKSEDVDSPITRNVDQTNAWLNTFFIHGICLGVIDVGEGVICYYMFAFVISHTRQIVHLNILRFACPWWTSENLHFPKHQCFLTLSVQTLPSLILRFHKKMAFHFWHVFLQSQRQCCCCFCYCCFLGHVSWYLVNLSQLDLNFGCVLVYQYTKELNINELRHNSMYGHENNRNSPVYRYTRTAPKFLLLGTVSLKTLIHQQIKVTLPTCDFEFVRTAKFLYLNKYFHWLLRHK